MWFGDAMPTGGDEVCVHCEQSDTALGYNVRVTSTQHCGTTTADLIT
jgi:hypothetical protein